jgi:LacI family transcriptional regulator
MPALSNKPARVLVVLELTETYAQTILRGVCRRGGRDPRLRLYSARLYPTKNLADQLEHFDAVIASLVDDTIAEIICSANVPVVNVSNRGAAFHRYSVVSDHKGALRRGMEHFLDRGLTRFATLGNVAEVDGMPSTLTGVMKYLGRIPYGEGHRVMSEGFILQTGEWLKKGLFPLGVFCGTDALAQQLAEICERNGISVPGDVAIIGSGNDEVACLSAHPSLSSVDMQFEGVGERAVDLLVDLLDGRTPEPPLRVVPAGSVLVRESSSDYAVSDPYVAKALHIMDEHLTSPLDISSLAERLHISRRMFEHRFRGSLNVTPAAYLRIKRLRRATELLENPDLHVTEVAYAAGFANAAHFCTVFRKQYGMTPNQFREKTCL